MQEELLRIQRDVHKTILFVSHDIEEAFKLGDQIAVLSEGKLIQLGSPIELLANPADDFVRQLVGADSILRQLQYLPVSTAMVNELDSNAAADSSVLPSCSSSATLLQAMFTLIEKNVTALNVYDEETQEYIGYVTLTSINREVTKTHSELAAK
jgi:osmoprotectant transport system ATP-binding protein